MLEDNYETLALRLLKPQVQSRSKEKASQERERLPKKSQSSSLIWEKIDLKFVVSLPQFCVINNCPWLKRLHTISSNHDDYDWLDPFFPRYSCHWDCGFQKAAKLWPYEGFWLCQSNRSSPIVFGLSRICLDATNMGIVMEILIGVDQRYGSPKIEHHFDGNVLGL